MSRASKKLAGLTILSPAQLREQWIALYEAEPPRLPANLMRLGLAYRLQELARRGLSARTVRELTDRTEGQPRRPSVDLRSGTQLLRSWNDKTITVTIEEDGFLYEGRHYRSLSAIARIVTGAHWSGPRFFGIGR